VACGLPAIQAGLSWSAPDHQDAPHVPQRKVMAGRDQGQTGRPLQAAVRSKAHAWFAQGRLDAGPCEKVVGRRVASQDQIEILRLPARMGQSRPPRQSWPGW